MKITKDGVLVVILLLSLVISIFTNVWTRNELDDYRAINQRQADKIAELAHVKEKKRIEYAINPYAIDSVCTIDRGDNTFIIKNRYQNINDRWIYDVVWMYDEIPVIQNGVIHDIIDWCNYGFPELFGKTHNNKP